MATVHYHTFAVELAAKLLENGILAPQQLLEKLQKEKASLENEDKIKAFKDGQSSNATYYYHIHTLFSLYSLSQEQKGIMRNLCFLPSGGISARLWAEWLQLRNLNDINNLIETGFVQSSLRHTISLHPMIQEIAVSETAPSVTNCHTLLDSLQKICLMHGIEVSYYKKLFQTVENIILFIEKDDIPQYLLFLEDVFPYMEKYHYQKGMKKIIQELQHFIKANTYGTASDHALLLDYQAALEIKTEKAIKLEKEALAQIKETTKENAHLVSNLHSNLGGLYRINGQLDLAKKHMEMGISNQRIQNKGISSNCSTGDARNLRRFSAPSMNLRNGMISSAVMTVLWQMQSLTALPMTVIVSTSQALMPNMTSQCVRSMV
ncbi:hypothetical protein JCM17039_06190 [Blautia glucerasea]